MIKYELKVIREFRQPDTTGVTKTIVAMLTVNKLPEDQERFAWNLGGDYLEIKVIET